MQALLTGLGPHQFQDYLPDSIATRVKVLPEDLTRLSPEELVTHTKTGKWTMVDTRLRVSFWREHVRAVDTRSPMKVGNVFSGICTSNYFYNVFLNDPVRLAYLTSQPVEYQTAMQDAHVLLMDKMRALAAMETDDPKIMALQMDALKFLQVHLYGSAIQRTETKNLNVNVNKQPQDLPLDMETINRRIKELEAKDLDAQADSRARTITVNAIRLDEPEGDSMEDKDHA